MQTQRRIILIMLTLFISISLLLILIPACSQNDGNSDLNGNADGNNQADSPDAGASPEQLTKEPFPEPEVPEKDYGGIEFNVLYPEWGMWGDIDYIFPETLTGDSMNDAVINRNKAVEDRINIRFKTVKISGNDEIKKILPAVKNSVLAGDGSYDLAFIHPMCDLNTFAADGLVRNWNKVPHVDFSKPYWNQTMNDTLAIKNILLFAGSDMIIPNACAIFFNKQIQRDYNIEDPYEIVKSGKWTWDKLTEIAKKVSRDLNGDGVYDQSDLYGFATIMDGPLIGAMHSCDQYIVRRDEEDYPHLDLMNEKLISIVDKMYDLIYNGNQTFAWKWYGTKEERDANSIEFTQNTSLFYIDSPAGAAEKYRAMEIDFGILPYPKYDETQERYISLNTAGLMLIPMDVKDVELCGIVTELLAAESRRYTLPVYFDTLLNYKVTRDEESEEMLNIIYNNTVYDFGYNYNGFTNVSYIVPRLMADKSTNVASFYEQNRDWTEKNMKKVYEDILKYEDRDY